MRLLVRRYVTAEQRKSEQKPVDEDDVSEIKQDIATFRFELIDILRANGYDTALAADKDKSSTKENILCLIYIRIKYYM